MSRYFVIFFLMMFSCNDTSVQPLDPECGEGVKTVVQDGRAFCVYAWPIVIETGFNCPSNFGFFQGFEPVFGVCTDFGALEEIEIRAVFEDFQKLPKFDPVVETQPEGLDLLFVVDNSGSMCQEQDRVIAAFESFITPLKDVDFHLGITTTQMTDTYSPEPLARAGELQSTPQAIPGFDQTCINDVDEMGVVIEDSFVALRARIDFAVGCMETNDSFYTSLTDEDIKCATGRGAQDCAIGNRCGGGNSVCSLSDIIPPSDSYRSLPKVFKASDYSEDGALNVNALSDDFRCALMVGTRGYGIEKGLGAAVLSVSKEKTGGVVDGIDADASKPNHGFLRKDSRFGLVFVSDENDCTHDGTIDEAGSCGDAPCAYAIESGEGLIPIAEIRSELVANLEESKGRSISDSDIVVGSIHGRPTSIELPIPDSCEDGETGVEPACATANGVAYSGSRYADFLEAYGESGYALSGASAICLEDWTEYFISMGSFFRAKSN